MLCMDGILVRICVNSVFLYYFIYLNKSYLWTFIRLYICVCVYLITSASQQACMQFFVRKTEELETKDEGDVVNIVYNDRRV
jgi:hypothetical protein